MLEAENLSKSYDGRRLALAGLDLTVHPGEVFCLLGANGAGKTTAINLFLGFIAPTEGAARIAGLDVQAAPIETKRHLAYIPEQVMLYPSLTGLENLRYFTGLAGYAYSEAELTDWLVGAGLPEEAVGRRVSGYSKGMRQKVGIAFAKAKRAKVLLLDEPTSGLDPKAANEFGQMIHAMRGKGAAILMATHDLFRARELGGRAGIMREGRLRETVDLAAVEVTDLEQLYLQHMSEVA